MLELVQFHPAYRVFGAAMQLVATSNVIANMRGAGTEPRHCTGTRHLSPTN